jgi:hypothetical protein
MRFEPRFDASKNTLYLISCLTNHLSDAHYRVVQSCLKVFDLLFQKAPSQSLCTSSIKPQYYKQSLKNIALLLSNSYSLDKIPVFTNSLEFGKMYHRILVQGGIGVSKSILKNTPSRPRLKRGRL